MKRYLLFVFLLVSTFYCSASFLSNKSKVYLFTCDPGEEVYSTFGHTAIYFQDPEFGLNHVFNYGIFDFDENSFLYKFIKGDTYYMLGVDRYDDFLWSYQTRESGVVGQELNLTQQEKENLFLALQQNALPENRQYLYNFFYDNCSTRPRDMIEKSIQGSIIYPKLGNNNQTYRDLVEMCVGGKTWLKFGIDLLLGSPADKIMTDRQKMFLPCFLMKNYSQATINRQGKIEPLVKATTQEVVVTKSEKQSTGFFSPLLVSCLILLLTLIITYLDFLKKKISVWFDFVLFFVAGLAGILISFVSFFSIHPTVFPNYNILWLHPIHLIFAFLLLIKCLRVKLSYYHVFNLVMLVFSFFLGIFAQKFNLAFFPLMLAFASRSFISVYQNIIRKE